ncbi:hypothetical protein AX16_008748 [Volvariella volvacea WC 439]|nr:hypothetical protein AX16_008748 [Volvariella volvacea WC 439]
MLLTLQRWRYVTAALKPACRLPVISNMNICQLITTAPSPFNDVPDRKAYDSSVNSLIRAASQCQTSQDDSNCLLQDPDTRLALSKEFLDLMEIQTKYFGELLNKLAIGNELISELKKDELAIAELVYTIGEIGMPPLKVEWSMKGQIRQMDWPVNVKLAVFIEDIRKMDEKLQRFYDKLKIGIDEVVIVNAQALSNSTPAHHVATN